MAPQFTESARDALEKAFQFAQEQSHTEVNENHLGLAFFEDSQGYFWTLSATLGLNPSTLVPQLEAALKKVPTFSGETQAPAISPQLQNRIVEAQAIAKKMGRRLHQQRPFLLRILAIGRRSFCLLEKKRQSDPQRSRSAHQTNERIGKNGLPHSRSQPAGPR